MPENLVDDPWLPVDIDGRVRLESLRGALAQSRQITDLALSPATLLVSVFRHIVLAVVLDALGPLSSPAEWERRWRQGLDMGVFDTYFDANKHRFNVFDDKRPFGQVAGLHSANNELKPVSVLVPALPTGNNVPLFGARTDNDPPALPWGQAACWLCHAHSWDTAAIKTGAVGDRQVKGGKTTGNTTGPLGFLGVVVPVGRTLFETIMLNSPIVAPDPRSDAPLNLGVPHWRREANDANWEIRQPTSFIETLTWQARRIRMVPERDPVAGTAVVSRVVLAAGDRMRFPPLDFEPHTLWAATSKPKDGDPPFRPRRLRSGRAAWRGLDGLVAANATTTSKRSSLLDQIGLLQAEESLSEDYPLGLRTVGIEYGNQSAVIENIIEDAIPLPVAALNADLQVGAVLARLSLDTDELVKALDNFEGNLCRALGGELVPWDKGQRASERFLHRLDPLVRRLLSGLRNEPQKADQAVGVWVGCARAVLRETAEEILGGLAPAAIRGRSDDKHTYNAATAEMWFWARVVKTLGSAPSLAAALTAQGMER